MKGIPFVYTSQNIGAEKPERIRDGEKASLAVVIGYSLIVAAITIPLARRFMMLFTTAEGEMIGIGATYLRTVALFWSFAGINHLYKSILTGAGDAVSAIYVNVAEMLCKLILSLVLTRFLGFIGIPVAALTGWIFAALIGWIIYRRGNWKNKSVVKRVKQ